MSRRAVFIDRDGVLIRDKGYLADPSGVELLAGAVEAMRSLRAAGFKLIVVSNQSGIARGFFSWAQLRRVNAEIRRLLARGGARWNALYQSPHGPASRHLWRKPNPGMLLAARRRFRLDLEFSYFVGDKSSDIECARRAGCVPILVRTGKGGRDRAYKAKPAAIRRNLLAAARWILSRGRRERSRPRDTPGPCSARRSR